MKTKQIRNWAFILHRYLGLVIGIITVIIGLTGSILVFYPEMDEFLITQKFGKITPQGEQVSVTIIAEKIKDTYGSSLLLESLNFPAKPDKPMQAWLASSDGKWTEAYINQYTGKILGDRQWETSLFGFIYQIHYQLLAGDIGVIIAGIVAFFLFILSLTGIMLWPGWRKLIAGFKIKFKAHPKRTNFDLHKVIGIVTAIFLGMIGLTGFCWNFYAQTEPLIYAATLTPKPTPPVSQPLPDKSSLSIEEILKKSDAALPDAETVGLSFPQSPEGVFRVRKRFQEEPIKGRSAVYLDQFTGKVLQVDNALQPSRAQAVLNSFGPLHFGTFGGLPTRIFYVFVGLAPAILFVTGLIMWWYRPKRNKNKSISVRELSKL
ncbi:MAG: PepSY domain-containing protein [Gomphosphaeria aponina SAG 52.96 = DSM 107014]|uniref:PepSY domain-containing protein n=1 Tax=Gomphosphaeria aponina SAG 52.96 = DSM 107014 TaxID=1521640 RepID=A0A941JUR9_9CHRO|nr:PepSY domain-containing protein [Gomphosphaeria aponina SAG 52.96 = DSM 107014]